MTVLEVRGDIRQTLVTAKKKAAEIGQKFAGAKRTNSRSVDLVLCVLPQARNTALYNEELVVDQKGGYLGNLILKINAKLGGVNTYVLPSDIPLNTGSRIPTIVIGIDVTHPLAGVTNGISIAAVVGSVDSGYAEYRCSVRVQAGRQEIVDDLHDMVIDLFEMFRERSKGVYPQRVIVYRDGVSEGQFSEVIFNELKSLKRAFVTLKMNKAPTVTFLSVNKRHHIRFFPTNQKDGDKNGNVMPSTVIDTGIVHPYEFDFFLNSHPGLQGTSRPTHFTKAVSIVPAYHAHLVAARARAHVEKDD
ncbi:argonaute 1, partial [Clydaea vesicula]